MLDAAELPPPRDLGGYKGGAARRTPGGWRERGRAQRSAAASWSAVCSTAFDFVVRTRMSSSRTLEHDWFPRPLPDLVTAGERSWIYSSFAFVHCHAQRPDSVRVGRETGIYHGTFFELGPDADVAIGEYCALVGAIINTNGRVRIGDYTFIAHEVVLADHAWAAPAAAEPRLVTSTATGDGIEIGENCWIGMGAVLLAGTKLAEGCVVGAGAVVNFAAPPYAIVAGNPARVVGTAR
jgi:acetyltransferase-like isoleucine patch superfamily enzyme